MVTQQASSTFAANVIEFFQTAVRPDIALAGFSIMDPFQEVAVQQAVHDFYTRYSNDPHERLFLIGINPGRFGGGITGIPFTDPHALREICGIESTLAGKRELSAEFIYQMIDHLGGPQSFYRDCYLAAVFPFALIRDGKNVNYYDDRALQEALTPYIVETVHRQLAFGARRDVAIVLGTGKNYRYFRQLNDEHQFWERLIPIEHPRFIMQYRRKRVPEYLDRYRDTIRAVLEARPDDSRTL